MNDARVDRLQIVSSRFFGAGLACTVLILSILILPGCDTDFPNALVDCAGDELHIAFLQEIVNDPDLTIGEQRQILEDLCILDEDVQDFILNNL